ncbi:hypothetical protein ACRE93_25785 [Klebsiella pneumoniae]
MANKAFLGIVFVCWEFYSQRPHNRRQGGFFMPWKCRLTGPKQGPLLIAQQQKEPTKKGH